MNTKEIIKSNVSIVLLYIVVNSIAFIAFLNLTYWCEIDEVKGLYNNFDEGFCFSPDFDLISEKAFAWKMENNLEDETEEGVDIQKIYYQNLINNVLHDKDVFAYNYSYVPIFQNDKEKLGVSYDYFFETDSLDKICFNITDGRMFEGNNLEAIVINSNKNEIGKMISFKDKKGIVTAFNVVGHIKSDFLPNSGGRSKECFEEYIDIKNSDKIIYLLNPNSYYIKNKMKKEWLGGTNLLIQSDSVIELENVKKELLDLGEVSYFPEVRALMRSQEKKAWLFTLCNALVLIIITYLDFCIQKSKLYELYVDNEYNIWHFWKRSVSMFLKNIVSIPFSLGFVFVIASTYSTKISLNFKIGVLSFTIINFFTFLILNWRHKEIGSTEHEEIH